MQDTCDSRSSQLLQVGFCFRLFCREVPFLWALGTGKKCVNILTGLTEVGFEGHVPRDASVAHECCMLFIGDDCGIQALHACS